MTTVSDTVYGMRTRRWRRVLASTATAAALAFIAAGMAVPAASAADTELITIGGFETGLTGWFANNGNATDGGTLSLTPDAYSGSSAVQVTGRTTTGSGPMQDLSIQGTRRISPD